jgi:hypothetical protein
MAQITLNEGLAWLKTLKKRHEELKAQSHEANMDHSNRPGNGPS